jgi:hypothetical protein
MVGTEYPVTVSDQVAESGAPLLRASIVRGEELPVAGAGHVVPGHLDLPDRVDPGHRRGSAGLVIPLSVWAVAMAGSPPGMVGRCS